MRMRFNMSRGLIARLSLCLGFVLLLALIASVAPAGAVAKTITCGDSCDKCVKEAVPDCKTTERCSPICRVRHEGKMTTVYFHFTRECCTWDKQQWCQPQSYCTTTTKCIPTGNAEVKPCKGQVKTCYGWVWDGKIHYGSCKDAKA